MADSASVAEAIDAGSGAPESTHSDISNDLKIEHVCGVDADQKIGPFRCVFYVIPGSQIKEILSSLPSFLFFDRFYAVF